MGAMGFYLRVGDATTCGGRILTGDETLSWYGVAGAREGDVVSCGRHSGTYKILGGTSDTLDEGRRLAGTLESISFCPCRARFIPSIQDGYIREDTPEEQAEKARLLAAAVPVIKGKEQTTKKECLTEEHNRSRVFAKSCLRGTGNTDAGTAEEPQANIGEMSFYQSAPSQPVPEPEQHAQAAKKKVSLPPPEPPKKKSLFDKVTGFFFGEAEAMPLPPPPVVMGGSAEAGMAAAAGGATAKANQDAAKALTHTMKHLSGPAVWSGSLAMHLPFVVMGAIIQSNLRGDKRDLLTPEKLLEVAHSRGTVPTRVRYNWITDDETGRLKATGYHTSAESGRDQVRVRMLEKPRDGSYEFWGDEQSDHPLITWTPASTPGAQDSWNTGNNSPQAGTVTIPGLEHPDIQGVTITTTPVPEEQDFRDYILVFPGNIHPPIYIYLSKPPVELLDVELYRDFKGRSRQGKYDADHMPSKAAVKRYLQQEYPGLDRDLIDSIANRVAAIVIPKEVHQKISQTYGGRNNSDQIARDAKDLKNALDRNFDAIKPALKKYGATEEQLESARTKMHILNTEQGLYK
ncbi:S-type pyocin domain-containing protein [Enterobacteriaceae bacterium LUAb1]